MLHFLFDQEWTLVNFLLLYVQLDNKGEDKDSIVILLLDMLEIVTRDIMEGDIEGLVIWDFIFPFLIS